MVVSWIPLQDVRVDTENVFPHRHYRVVVPSPREALKALVRYDIDYLLVRDREQVLRNLEELYRCLDRIEFRSRGRTVQIVKPSLDHSVVFEAVFDTVVPVKKCKVWFPPGEDTVFILVWPLEV